MNFKWLGPIALAAAVGKYVTVAVAAALKSCPFYQPDYSARMRRSSGSAAAIAMRRSATA